jgi:hypothetical protein
MQHTCTGAPHQEGGSKVRPGGNVMGWAHLVTRVSISLEITPWPRGSPHSLARSSAPVARTRASEKCYAERISRSSILCGRVLLQPDRVSGSVQPDTKRQTTKPRFLHVRGQGRGMHAPLECTPCGRPCHGRRRATESALHESCLAIARVSCFCHHHHHHPQSAPALLCFSTKWFWVCS